MKSIFCQNSIILFFRNKNKNNLIFVRKTKKMSVPNLLPELISKPRKVLLKKKDDDSNYVPHDSDFGSDDEDYDDNNIVITEDELVGKKRPVKIKKKQNNDGNYIPSGTESDEETSEAKCSNKKNGSKYMPNLLYY